MIGEAPWCSLGLTGAPWGSLVFTGVPWGSLDLRLRASTTEALP